MKTFLNLSIIFSFLVILSCEEAESNHVSESKNNKEIKVESGPSLELSGTVSNNATQINLTKIKDGKFEVVDSTQIINHKFDFGQLESISPQMYFLSVNNLFRAPIFVENSKITVEFNGASEDSVKISGSNIQTEWEELRLLFKSEDHTLQLLYDKYQIANQNNDAKLIKEIESEYNKVDSLKKDKIKVYVNTNKSSYLTPFLVSRFFMSMADVDELNEYVSNFDKSILNSIYVDELTSKIALMEVTKIGNVIPDFIQTDKDGQVLNISDLRGKYVLIDFWASWCGPCRGENPNVVAMYNKYKSKDFTVLGISLDDNREKWLKAIDDDKLAWHHVSDLTGWGNPLVKQFGIGGIPFSILIDKDGIVLAKNLREDDLKDFLKNLFENK